MLRRFLLNLLGPPFFGAVIFIFLRSDSISDPSGSNLIKPGGIVFISFAVMYIVGFIPSLGYALIMASLYERKKPFSGVMLCLISFVFGVAVSSAATLCFFIMAGQPSTTAHQIRPIVQLCVTGGIAYLIVCLIALFFSPGTPAPEPLNHKS
jgi:hypothetical protein